MQASSLSMVSILWTMQNNEQVSQQKTKTGLLISSMCAEGYGVLTSDGQNFATDEAMVKSEEWNCLLVNQWLVNQWLVNQWWMMVNDVTN